ncbi:MAG: 2-oxoacid:acceptor oxidoreductase family protein [Deltaproteobacteria bacterium]|nr:2-oxoacid:acceptor oxidoreductase family protein [Deltaproteobacteria bacterium]
MDRKIVLAGVGGQGIIFMTRMVGQTALNMGLNVMGSETHGMAQRGGSVISFLKVGNYRSAQIGTAAADVLISLNDMEFMRNLPYLKPAGLAVVNAPTGYRLRPELADYLTANGIEMHVVPADALATEHRLRGAVNLIVLGAAAVLNALPVAASDILETIKQVTPHRLREGNETAFSWGARAAME